MQVGEVYENRRTKKVGVIETVDDKFKTILMRDSEGGTFNISFSTFKSNWRKYKGDEVVQTSTQVEETKTEAEQAKNSIKKKSSKSRISREDKYRIINDVKTVVEGVIDKNYPYLIVRTSSRGGIAVKYHSSILTEIWPKPHLSTFNVRLPKDNFELIKSDLGEHEVCHFKNDTLSYSIRGFNLTEVETILNMVLDTYDFTDDDSDKEEVDEEEVDEGGEE